MPWNVPQLRYSDVLFDPESIASIGDSAQESMDRRRARGLERRTSEAFRGGIPMRADGSPDYAAMATRLFEAGNVDTGMGLTRLAETQAQTAFERSQPRYQNMGDALLEMPSQYGEDPRVVYEEPEEPPEPEKPPAGYRRTDTGLEFEPGGPADPQVVERNQRLRRPPMTAVDKKAVMEADDLVMAGENAVSALDRALELNSTAMSGPLAGTRGYVGSTMGDYLPDGSGLGTGMADKAAGVATEEFQNVVMQQVLENLKATFGGMPTEGERKVLIDVQGSVNKAPEVREAILKRAKLIAEKRIQFNRSRAAELRGGTFYNEQGGVEDITAGPAEEQLATDFEAWEQVPEGALVEDESGNRFRKQNGKPVPVQ